MPGEPGDPGRGWRAGPGEGSSVPGGWEWGGGKTFLLPGDDVKTPGLEEKRMGLGGNGGHAGAGEWEWGLGCAGKKGVRAVGSAAGRAGGPPHNPPQNSPTLGKGAPSPGTAPRGGRRCCTHETGNSTSPSHTYTTPGRGSRFPSPAGSRGGNAGPCPWGQRYLEVAAAVPRGAGEPWAGLRHGRGTGGAWWRVLHVFRRHFFLSLYAHTKKNTAHTLLVSPLVRLGPAFTIFIVKFVVVIIILFSGGTSKGLIPLVALSDVMMIYRHSLGKAGILLPGSLEGEKKKSLCYRIPLCFCRACMGCEMG